MPDQTPLPTSNQCCEVAFPFGHTVAHEEDCPRCENDRLRAGLVSVMAMCADPCLREIAAVAQAALSGASHAQEAPVVNSAPNEVIARAYNRLQAADVPRDPWHWEVSRILLTPHESPVETAAERWEMVARDNSSALQAARADLEEALKILAIALPGPRPWPTEGVDAKLRIYRNMAEDQRRSAQETTERCIHGAVVCEKCATMAINSAPKASEQEYRRAGPSEHAAGTGPVDPGAEARSSRREVTALSDYCEEHFNLLTPGRWQAEIDRCVAIEQQKYRDLYDAMSKERLNFDKGGDAFHVLRILGNGQISAGKARELLLEMQAGINPELMPFEAESPVETTVVDDSAASMIRVAAGGLQDLISRIEAKGEKSHWIGALPALREAHAILQRRGLTEETSAPLTPAEMGTIARMAAVSAQVQPEKASAERCRSGHLYEGRLVQCCKDENHSGRHYNLTVDYHWGSENGSAKP